MVKTYRNIYCQYWIYQYKTNTYVFTRSRYFHPLSVWYSWWSTVLKKHENTIKNAVKCNPRIHGKANTDMHICSSNQSPHWQNQSFYCNFWFSGSKKKKKSSVRLKKRLMTSNLVNESSQVILSTLCLYAKMLNCYYWVQCKALPHFVLHKNMNKETWTNVYQVWLV